MTVVLACAAVCLFPCLLPQSYFRPRSFERGNFYPRLGLKWFRLLATDGDLINQKLRLVDPSYRVVRTRAELREYIRGTYTNERAHLVLFLVGIFTTIFAIVLREYIFAAMLTLGNITFNLYPVLHQRYKRARLLRSGT